MQKGNEKSNQPKTIQKIMTDCQKINPLKLQTQTIVDVMNNTARSAPSRSAHKPPEKPFRFGGHLVSLRFYEVCFNCSVYGLSIRFFAFLVLVIKIHLSYFVDWPDNGRLLLRCLKSIQHKFCQHFFCFMINGNIVAKKFSEHIH